MGIARGPNLVKDNLVFGYDTGYGVADNSTATRFYPGENTTNFVTTNLETLGTDGSGQSSIGTRTTIAPNHVRIVDVASNTRQSHLISGLTASTIYTVSIQFKKITGTPTFRFQLQGYSGSSYVNTIKFTSTAETGLEDIEGWQTAEWTFTLPSNCNALRIWWQDGADYTTYTHSFELKNPQLEAKSHVTPYVSGTRSSTASLIDLKRTTNIDVSNVSFDSTGQPEFDGTDDYIPLTGILNNEDIGASTAYTVDMWLKPGVYSSRMPFSTGQNGNNRIYYWTDNGLNTWRIGNYTSTSGHGTLPTVGTWYNTTLVINGTNITVYLNGEEDYTGSYTTFNTQHYATFGRHGASTSYYYTGKIAVARLHERVLSAEEVKQNYNAYKNRFNI